MFVGGEPRQQVPCRCAGRAPLRFRKAQRRPVASRGNQRPKNCRVCIHNLRSRGRSFHVGFQFFFFSFLSAAAGSAAASPPLSCAAAAAVAFVFSVCRLFGVPSVPFHKAFTVALQLTPSRLPDFCDGLRDLHKSPVFVRQHHRPTGRALQFQECVPHVRHLSECLQAVHRVEPLLELLVMPQQVGDFLAAGGTRFLLLPLIQQMQRAARTL